MRTPQPPTSFQQLQTEWYKKLKDEGFRDIEASSDPDGPLKEWHSFHFVSLRTQKRVSKRSPYQEKIDTFANDPSFHEVVTLMGKHGNNKFTSIEIETIWTLHRDGIPERGIANEMKCSKSCIHFLLRRMKEWMKLVA